MPEEWPEFPSSVALLDKNISFVLNHSRERCDLWEQNDFYSYAWINWASSSSLVVLIHPQHFHLTVWHEQSFIVWLCSIDAFIRLRRAWGEYCAQLFDLQENTCFRMKEKSHQCLNFLRHLETKSNSNGDSGLSDGENILERSRTVIKFAYKVRDHNMNLNISNQTFPSPNYGLFRAGFFLTVCLHVFFYLGTNI